MLWVIAIMCCFIGGAFIIGAIVEENRNLPDSGHH